MYKVPKRTPTSIEKNDSIGGDPIEVQIQRMINNGEVLGEEKEMIYTKPSDGVVYGTDIRGDKQEKAIEMTEKVAHDVMRRRELKALKEKEEREKKDNKTDEKPTENQGQNQAENNSI